MAADGRRQPGLDEDRVDEHGREHTEHREERERHADEIGSRPRRRHPPAREPALRNAFDGRPASGRIDRVTWLSVALLASAVAVLIAAELPRLERRLGADARRSRARARRKQNLRLIRPEQPERPPRSESEEFAASVERDLALLPTIDEQEERGRGRGRSSN